MANKDNPKKGSDFEIKALRIFNSQGIKLINGFPIDVGASRIKRPHKFDLGSASPKVLVECKFHTWTSGGNSPSAKLTIWNEAMHYFACAPPDYRKILFVLKDIRNGESLAQYYLKRYEHLVPQGIEIWEYDSNKDMAYCIYDNAIRK